MRPALVEIVEGDQRVTLIELAHAIGVEVTWVEELVAEGVVRPVAPGGHEFETISIIRLRKAHRLAHDFSLNTPGVALVIDLLDEIDRLRGRLPRSAPVSE